TEAAEALEGSAEDWSTSLRMLCKACSEGRPHKEHDTKAAPVDGVHLIGIAARTREHATQIVNAWQAAARDLRIEALEEALPPPSAICSPRRPALSPTSAQIWIALRAPTPLATLVPPLFLCAAPRRLLWSIDTSSLSARTSHDDSTQSAAILANVVGGG